MVHSERLVERKPERNWLPPTLVGFVIILCWYGVIRVFEIPPYLFPPPHAVINAGIERWDSLLIQVWHTFIAAVIAFVLSAVVGITIATVMTQFTLLRKGLYPYTTALQTVPVVAVAPLIIVWLGAGKPAIIAIAFIVSLFPVIANTSLGLTSTEKNLQDLMDMYDASPLQKLFKLKIPYALPHIMGGLRISSGLAVIGTIIGEFVGGMGGLRGGIGYVVTVAARLMEMDYLFAAVLASIVLGMSTFWAVNTLSNYLLRHWHDSTTSLPS